MNVLFISIVIQGVLLLLMGIIFILLKVLSYRGKVWQCVVLTGVLCVVLVGFALRVCSFNIGGLYYIHKASNSFRKVNYTRMSSVNLERYNVPKEWIEDSQIYDKIKVYIKDDTSDVSFWDILFCRKNKWMVTELVESTGYVVLNGSDIVVSTERVLIPGQFVYAQNRTYVMYDGYHYEVNLPECGIEDDGWYVLVWDTLSLSNGCYSVCKLEKYEGK